MLLSSGPFGFTTKPICVSIKYHRLKPKTCLFTCLTKLMWCFIALCVHMLQCHEELRKNLIAYGKLVDVTAS